jgi:hypothetical protein
MEAIMWKTVLLLIPVGLALSMCASAGLRGSGQKASRSLQVSDFDQLSVSSMLQVTLHLGQAPQGRIEGDDNVIGLVKVNQDGKRLSLEMEREVDTRMPLKVELWTGTLKELGLSGASRITVEGLTGGSLDLDASGASQVVLEGKLDLLSLDLSGASSLQGRTCRVQRADLELSGAANADLVILAEMDAECSGASHLDYRGQPKVISMENSGAATITSHPLD